MAGFFRATFLAELTSDPEQLTPAAGLLHTIEPYDADLLMAFTYHLDSAPGHQEFKKGRPRLALLFVEHDILSPCPVHN